MKDNSDIDRIADLCLNYTPRSIKYDELEDQVRLLKLEVELLTNRINLLENKGTNE